MELAEGGGGGPSWTGTIKVVPGHLEASSSGFIAAGNGVMDVAASSVFAASPEGAGITDPTAAAAFARMVKIWTGDLDNLSSTYGTMSGNLATASDSYHQTDNKAVGYNVHGTSITRI